MSWLAFRMAYFSGKEALKKQELEKSERNFRKALEQISAHPEAAFSLAQVLWNLGKKTEARLLLEDLLSKQDHFPAAYFLLGKFSEEEKSYEQASGWLEKAVELDPKNAETWHELGKIRLKLNRPLEALKAFRKATQMDPFITPSQLSLLQEKLGRAGNPTP